MKLVLDRSSGRSLDNKYGPGEAVIWMDELQCKGTETNLADCGHLGWSQHNCGHREDVSISCTTPSTDSPDGTGSTGKNLYHL